jgi:hypothetical protein
LTALEDLRLDRLRITDKGLECLRAFPNLKRLSLWRTLITQDGLGHLSTLTLLERLSLDETRVSDEGLKALYGLSHLHYLSLWKTMVSDNGVQEIKANLPRVKVNR